MKLPVFFRSASPSDADARGRRRRHDHTAPLHRADDAGGEEVDDPRRAAGRDPSGMRDAGARRHGAGHRPGGRHQGLRCAVAVAARPRRGLRRPDGVGAIRWADRAGRHARGAASDAHARHRPDPRRARCGRPAADPRRHAQHRDVGRRTARQGHRRHGVPDRARRRGRVRSDHASERVVATRTGDPHRGTGDPLAARQRLRPVASAQLRGTAGRGCGRRHRHRPRHGHSCRQGHRCRRGGVAAVSRSESPCSRRRTPFGACRRRLRRNHGIRVGPAHRRCRCGGRRDGGDRVVDRRAAHHRRRRDTGDHGSARCTRIQHGCGVGGSRRFRGTGPQRAAGAARRRHR